jgi:hypothetical protein
MERVIIAPNFVVDLPGFAPTLDVKIGLFERQVRGWQLNIAQELIDKIEHSAFGVLAIVMSYPEKIWQLVNGRSSENRESRLAFREGMGYVRKSSPLEIPDDPAQLDFLYEHVRCGLYHDGGTTSRVRLSEGFPHAFAFVGEQIHINPHRLPRVFIGHLESYAADLRDPRNEGLRTNFEKMFGSV